MKNKAILLLSILLLSMVLSSCRKSGEDGIFELISRRWLEVSRVVNNAEQPGNGRQHIFFSDGRYEFICGVNELCPQFPTGVWQLFSDTRMQTNFNGVIVVYDIKKLELGALWLEDIQTKDLLKLEPR